MEQALAYVCCSAEESRVKVQKYCRKIYELGYVPILSLIHIYVTTGNELEGAKLQVIDKDGTVLEEWISTKAVSYTHLDVYKRQGVYCRIS